MSFDFVGIYFGDLSLYQSSIDVRFYFGEIQQFEQCFDFIVFFKNSSVFFVCNLVVCALVKLNTVWTD